MYDKICNYLKALRNGTRADYSIIIGITLLFLLIIAMNVRLVFNMISDQTEEIGQMQLESIRSDLENKIINSESITMQLASEAESLIFNGSSLAQIFYTKKEKSINIVKWCMF